MTGYAVALILGSLLPLAFAPFDLWPLAIAIPIALLYLFEKQWTAKQTFILGWLVGLGYFGFGVYWIYHSLHDFGAAPPVVATAITGLLVVYLALAPALTFLLYRQLRDKHGAVAIWSLPALWFALEWMKGWFLTGMPWLSLGYSQTDTWMAGWAPVLGVYGIGALCWVIAIAIYQVVRIRQWKQIFIPPVIILAGLGLQQVDWTRPTEENLKVTLVQGNIPQELKWRYDERQAIFNTYWRETSQHWDSDLIVWPEAALPGSYPSIDRSVVSPMQEAAVENKTPILTGLIYNDLGEREVYNSLMLIDEDRSLYHKRHLVLFGEYYPMRWLMNFLAQWLTIPHSDLTHGPRDQPQVSLNGIVLGLSICFEDVFSRQIDLAMPAAGIFVNVTNDAWFGDSTAPHQHLQIARMRSMEFGRPMVRAANTGISAFIDHKGKLSSVTGQFRTQSLTDNVIAREGVTPFYYVEKIQGWLAVFILVLTLYGLGFFSVLKRSR